MKKILVTGKNGYIANCFKKYIENNYEEYEIDLISVRNDEWKKKGFNEYFAVFNTIGLTHNNARAGAEEEFYRLNSTLPYEIAVKAKQDGVRMFIHMSSMIVYGNMSGIGETTIIDSNTLPNPCDSIYGKSKLSGEFKLQELKDEKFSVAIIRSPLIYGCNTPDNVEKLIKYAMKFPIFPNIKNSISMIYDENLCELIRLILEHNSEGVFFPQMETSICTSKFVKDLANESENKIWFTCIFNPLLKLLSKKFLFIGKAFGNQEYEAKLSNAFDGKYRIISYSESIKRIIDAKRENNIGQRE